MSNKVENCRIVSRENFINNIKFFKKLLNLKTSSGSIQYVDVEEYLIIKDLACSSEIIKELLK